MESMESCAPDPKGGKKGVKVCKDKRKTKRISQESFGLGKKYNLGDRKKKTDEEYASRPQNVRDLENSPWDIKLQGETASSGLSEKQYEQGRKLEKERAEIKRKMNRAKKVDSLKTKLKLKKKDA